MKNDIKKMLKKISEDQEIHDIQKLILDNVDKSKVLNPEPKIKPLAPKKRRFVFPVLLGALATAVFVVTFVIAFNFRNSDPENNPVEPSGQVEPEPIIYDDVSINVAEAFYSDFTKNDASNMINIVNTFNNVSYVEVSNTTIDDEKHITPEFEESIVNDVDAFRFNIAEMFGKETTTRTQSLNENPDYNFKKVINVTNDSFNYHIYYTENIEVIKSGESSFRYKSNLSGVIVSGDNLYFIEEGKKNIKNSKLEYNFRIRIDDFNYVEVKEQYYINSDLTINYDTFNYNYIYHSNDNVKNVIITQKFKDKETKEVKFISNKGKLNEVNMTFKKNDMYYMMSSLDSRGSEELYISKNDNSYTYKFKNSNNEYVR